MAEGPTVARWADQLQPFVGETVRALQAPKRWQERAQALIGQTLTSVRSHGKNLLLTFSDGTVIRCHAMMYGSWQIGEAGLHAIKPEPRIRLRLRTDRHEAIFYSGPVTEFLTPAEAAAHPVLTALGPDILDAHFDRDEAWRRLQDHPHLTLAEALLDQTLIAGIGNIWKSEALYLARLDPRRQVATLTRAELDHLFDLVIPLMQESRQTGSITTVPAADRGPGLWRWVYGRTGRPCQHCKGKVQMILQGPGRRRTYFCEACQH